MYLCFPGYIFGTIPLILNILCHFLIKPQLRGICSKKPDFPEEKVLTDPLSYHYNSYNNFNGISQKNAVTRRST